VEFSVGEEAVVDFALSLGKLEETIVMEGGAAPVRTTEAAVSHLVDEKKIRVTDGAFSDDGAFHPLEAWDGDVVMKLFRERLLAYLIERHAISQDFALEAHLMVPSGFLGACR